MTKTNKIIIITGASRGLGFDIADCLSEKGHIVYATARNLEKAKKLKDLSRKNLIIKKLNITDDQDISDLIDEIIEKEGRIDVLINNAGYGLFGPVDGATIEQLKEQFDVNVFGAFRLIQKVLPHMKSQKEGTILTVSSLLGIEGCSFMGAYSTTKFAIEGMISSLAPTLAKWNIKMSLIQPGAMNTDFVDAMEDGNHYEPSSNPYVNFNTKARAFLKEILAQGQCTKEVAKLISNLLELDHLPLRIQTCPNGKSMAEQCLVDATGNKWADQHRNLIKDWF